MTEPFQVLEYAVPGYRFVLAIPVQFRDVDGMGHANNVAYFAFLESARIEYFVRLMNMEDKAENISTMPFVLAGQSIDYRSQAFFRDVLLIAVRTSWVKRSSFGFEFEMREQKTNRLVADGRGTHVMFDNKTGRSMPMPDDWLEKLEAFEGRKLRS